MNRMEGWPRMVSTRGQTNAAGGGECGNGLGQIRAEIDTVLHRDAFAPISCSKGHL